MGKLFRLKKWLTITDTAKYLSSIFDEEMNDADVLRLALDGCLTLSVLLIDLVDAKKAFIRDIPKELKESRFVVIEGDQCLTTQSDEIVRLNGVLDLPWLGREKLDVENRYRKMIGEQPIEMDRSSLPTLYVKDNLQLYELQDSVGYQFTEEEKDLELKQQLQVLAMNSYVPRVSWPQGSLYVVKVTSLLEFEKSLANTENNANRISDNTLLSTIAALLASFPKGKQPTGKELEKAASSVGISISDDSIRKALKAARDLASDLPSA
jgi:hypothetical protein